MIIQSVRDVGDDLFPTATPSVHPYYIPIPIDNTPLSPMAMIAVKIYAFGGLVFMIAVIIAAIVYWFWTILIKREWADSPGWLDLHPERMRERERVRIARMKSLKEERLRERKRREEEKFTPPPLRYKAMNGRDRATSMPVKSAIRNSSMSDPHSSHNRKSSLSKSSPSSYNQRGSWASSIQTLGAPDASPSKTKKVSWASSASTLDVEGNCTEKPLACKSSPTSSLVDPEPPVIAPASLENINHPTSVPRARTSIPRREASIAPRSRRASEMIATTTPEVAFSWAKPSDPIATRCTCSSVDPLDASSSAQCQMHPIP
ncbi:hypothetical protein CVT26_005915 [Gymnopilus dilepis]|uniref:Uncharacterized protein n=1 Tax=Gymnopilus dilepis TaxID=231916 RepID=A0A409VQ05_9AGAR|nr:hypothetical protein CVT26_005915 [Gymnopilus dilepis]